MHEHLLDTTLALYYFGTAGSRTLPDFFRLRKKNYFTSPLRRQSSKGELFHFQLSISRRIFVRPTPTLNVPAVVMPVPQFSIPVVHGELSSLDISKGAGPDDIHPRMVRWLANFLAELLSNLFANSIITAVIPTYWHLAIIYPIHIKGEPKNAFEY